MKIEITNKGSCGVREFIEMPDPVEVVLTAEQQELRELKAQVRELKKPKPSFWKFNGWRM